VDTEPLPTEGRAREAIRGGRLGSAFIGATAAALFALIGVSILGRYDRAPALWLTVALFVLPYLYGLLIAWVFALWCVLPDRRSIPLLLMAALLWMAGLWGPAMAIGTETVAGTPVRVMSWNVRRLWGGPEDGDDPLACVVDAVQQAGPDVLVLLEVSRENMTALEGALGMRCVHGTYTAAASGDRRGGLATCARAGASLIGGRSLRFVDDEDWHYVASELAVADRVFNVLAVHLTPYRLGASEVERAVETAAGQANQSAALLERVERFRDPTVVAGDFNSTRDFSLHAALRSHLSDTWESGALGLGATKLAMDWLPLRIDYIYASSQFAVVDTEVLQVGCSDHRPVVSSLVLRAP